MRARREAHHAMPRDDGNDGFANVLLARMNCGKHALETSNRDHIAAPLVGERQLLPCVTAYRKQTCAALKRGNRGVAERRGSAALVCVLRNAQVRRGENDVGGVAVAARAFSGALRIGRGSADRIPFPCASTRR
jgi:hypothetical protein